MTKLLIAFLLTLLFTCVMIDANDDITYLMEHSSFFEIKR
jgi:hypothetical protein